MKRSDRKRESLEIVGGGYIVTGPDEETVAKNLEWVRYRVAFYGSTPNYFPVWEVHGLEDLGKKLHQMSREKLWDEMPNEIDDDVLKLFAAIGTYENVAKEIETRFGGASGLRREWHPRNRRSRHASWPHSGHPTHRIAI